MVLPPPQCGPKGHAKDKIFSHHRPIRIRDEAGCLMQANKINQRKRE